MGNKIESLLKQAREQEESPTPEMSSIIQASRDFSNDAEAAESFRYFSEKLFRIDRWNAESEISSFELYDEKGIACPEKIAALNYFIKITLPGSGKDDWVKIIKIQREISEIILTVNPSSNPTADDSAEKTTSHFFTSESTNNFCLEKKDQVVKIYVIGLSEKSNTQDTKNVLESVRNFATANIAHYLGVQKKEWSGFCENFLEIDKA